MAERHMTVGDLSFRTDSRGIWLVLTFYVGNEVMVEELPLGDVDPREILASLQTAVAQWESIPHARVA